MQSRAIPNDRISASSIHSNGYKPYLARLGTRKDGVLHGAWAPIAPSMNTISWIQVDLVQQTTVSRIATQGRPDFVQWVKTYSIEYGTDGNSLTEYRNRLNVAVFQGNTDQNTIVYNILDPPIFTRYVRIRPKSHEKHVAMRFEVYGGCDRPGDNAVLIL